MLNRYDSEQMQKTASSVINERISLYQEQYFFEFLRLLSSEGRKQLYIEKTRFNWLLSHMKRVLYFYSVNLDLMEILFRRFLFD